MKGVFGDTLTFSKIAKQMANHYGLDNFMSIHLVFTYDSYV